MGGKRRKRKLETPYSRVTEVREAGTSDEANRLLNDGFVLIKAVERRETDAIGRQASTIIYILGRLAQNGKARTTNNEPVNIMDDRPDVPPAVLEGRPWKKYGSGEGEWTFVTNMDGTSVAELAPAKEFLERLKGGEDLVVGGYKYRLRDRFLKRYPVNE